VLSAWCRGCFGVNAASTKTRCGRPIVRIYTVYPYDFLNPDRRSKKHLPSPSSTVDGNRNILPRDDAGRELSSFEAKIRQFKAF